MGTRSHKRQGRRRLASEINVVPYIDVMLVLLIIFMVTAPLLTTGVNVDLPQAPAKVLDMAEDQPVVLTVTADGEYSLNVGPEPDAPLSASEVVQIAGQVIAERPKVPVAVRGDGQGNYADVVRGMVMLQQAGAEKVGLITDNVETEAGQ